MSSKSNFEINGNTGMKSGKLGQNDSRMVKSSSGYNWFLKIFYLINIRL